jgi:hypothetical protein
MVGPARHLPGYTLAVASRRRRRDAVAMLDTTGTDH